MVEIKVFPNGGPMSHIQTREHEGFYVLEGELSFTVDGKGITATSGTFVNVPPNISHSVKNKTDGLAKVFVVLVPEELENLFIEVGDEVSDPTIQLPPMSIDKTKRFAEIASNYGVEIKH